MKVGSLCTGIAGLELGLRLAGIDVEPVFVSDIDLGANTWLAANMPNTPNLGDFTALDQLPEVDLITAGFPCQPFSAAGKRTGLTDERYLFDDIARLTSRMGSRPVLFLENVPGLLTANDGHAMARIVHQLAAIGYHITYGTLSAAAVGAPHRRLRWWGLAYPADTDSSRFKNELKSISGEAKVSWDRSDRDAVENTDSVRQRCEARLEKKNSERSNDRAIRSGSDAENTDSESSNERRFAAFREEKSRRARTDPGRRGGASAADTASAERRGPQQQDLPSPTGSAAESQERSSSLADRFGPYAPAIDRWERILGRPAPDPTDNGRLSPPFVEWMMGYPQGWVTDPMTSRNHSLKALGNAVVPQCAAAAFTQLKQRVPAS